MRCISQLFRDMIAFHDSWVGPQTEGNPFTDSLIEHLKKHNVPQDQINKIKPELSKLTPGK